MDAKALHGLYAPLWRIAPDTRPKSITFDADESEQFMASFGTMHGNWHTVIVPVEVAADLCRASAHDYLIATGNWFVIDENNDKDDQDTERFSVLLMGVGEAEDVDAIGEGPTVHHALVVACLNLTPPSTPPAPRPG